MLPYAGRGGREGPPEGGAGAGAEASDRHTVVVMCRNIRTLSNFAPPATEEEVYAAALQYVRKVAGTTRPSRANEAAFDSAVEDVAAVTRRLLDALVTTAPAKDREVETAKARERAAVRYGRGA